MVFTDGIHLMAESISELHAFANSIGLNKCWFHSGARHPHYDLYTGKNKQNRIEMLNKAIDSGALKVSTRQLVTISRVNYFFPTSDQEIELWEVKNKWRINQPVTPKEKEILDEIHLKILTKIRQNDRTQ